MTTWHLLPPADGACQVCARKHDPRQPHDPQSLYWATAREMQGLSPPTWELALEHVEPEHAAKWRAALRERGIDVSG